MYIKYEIKKNFKFFLFMKNLQKCYTTNGLHTEFPMKIFIIFANYNSVNGSNEDTRTNCYFKE